MNNEVTIILSMMAGSEVFNAQYKYDIKGAVVKFTLTILSIYGPPDLSIYAKRVEDMSDGERDAYWDLIDRSTCDMCGHDIGFSRTFQSERYLISKGYLPEYLAGKLIKAGINVEWV